MMNVNKKEFSVKLETTNDYDATQDLINNDFIEVETKEAINKVVDYEKKMFIPLISGQTINTIRFNIHLWDGNQHYLPTFGDLGYTYDEVKYKNSVFKDTYIKISLYDSPNPNIRRVLGEKYIYLDTYVDNFERIQLDPNRPVSILDVLEWEKLPVGPLKDINTLPLQFRTNNPRFNSNINNDSFYLFLISSLISESQTIYYTVEYRSKKTGFGYLLGNKRGGVSLYEIQNTLSSPLTVTNNQNTIPSYEFIRIGDNNLRFINNDLTIDLFEIISQ